MDFEIADHSIDQRQSNRLILDRNLRLNTYRVSDRRIRKKPSQFYPFQVITQGNDGESKSKRNPIFARVGWVIFREIHQKFMTTLPGRCVRCTCIFSPTGSITLLETILRHSLLSELGRCVRPGQVLTHTHMLKIWCVGFRSLRDTLSAVKQIALLIRCK